VRVSFADSTEQDYGQRTVIVNNLLNQAPFASSSCRARTSR